MAALDNISVVERSQPLPPGYSLEQADATGWVAMFALNMTAMALELAITDSDYENIALPAAVRRRSAGVGAAAVLRVLPCR